MALGDHVTLKSRTRGFNVRWRMKLTPQNYGCKYSNSDSLRPVLPGKTRAEMGYCLQCRAEVCLFARPEPEVIEWQDQSKIAARRAKGLTSGGMPLKRSCWNCANVRIKLSGYVCQFEPEAEPKSMGSMTKMRKRAEACEAFEWRRGLTIMDISEEMEPF